MTRPGPRRVDQGMAYAASSMLPDTIDKDLRTRYRQLPIMVRTAGLAATMAFLVAKSDEKTDLGRAYQRVATGIRKHLSAGPRTAVSGLSAAGDTVGAAKANESLLAALAAMRPGEYARAAAEAEMLACWLSRLADARWQADQ